MDFKTAQEWKDKQIEDPCDVYQIVVPCTSFSMAHTTPTKTRTLDNPYGDETDPDIVAANELLLQVMYFALALLSKGVVVLFENPLMSYFFFLLETSTVFGFPEFEMIRSDHCQDGAPYQKPQTFVGNTSALVDVGRLCNHVQHPERLVGTATRRSSPYPRGLCERIVGGFVKVLQSTGRLGTDCSEMAQKWLTSTVGDMFPSGPSFAALAAEGRRRIGQLRHGSARATTLPLPPPGLPPPSEKQDPSGPHLRVEVPKADSY